MDAVALLGNQLYRLDGQSVSMGAVISAAILLVVSLIFLPRAQKWLKDRFGSDRATNRRFLGIVSYALYFVVLLAAINLLGLYGLLKAELGATHKEVTALLDLRLFAIGKTSLTLSTCVYVLALSWILIRSTEKISSVISTNLLARTKLERGLVETCAASARYFVMVVGLAIILQSAGIDLSALSFIAGAAGIAIGLGLQTLMNNVVSGFVILVDRPVKIGDRIDIGGVNGEVTHISIRATTIITNDNIAVIVPNSQLISAQVVNWTYKSKKCRFQIPFFAARDASPSLIQRLLTEAGQEHKGVLKDPPPKACFDEFAETKLKFSLALWTEDYVSKSGELRSDINYAIAQKFAANGLTLDGVKAPLPPDEASPEAAASIAMKQSKSAA